MRYELRTFGVIAAVGFVGLFMACLTGAGCDAKSSADEDAIRQTVVKIEEANQGKDGETAASLFTSGSIARYTKVMDAALHAKREQLDKLDAWDLNEVLRIRMQAKAKQIEGLDSRGYVVFATSQGWYYDPDFTPTELGTIRVNGDKATAQELIDGEKSPFLTKFEREDGVWKLDEESWRAPFNRMVREDSDGESQAEYVLWLLEEEMGKEAPDSIWQPMINPVGAFKPGG